MNSIYIKLLIFIIRYNKYYLNIKAFFNIIDLFANVSITSWILILSERSIIISIVMRRESLYKIIRVFIVLYILIIYPWALYYYKRVIIVTKYNYRRISIVPRLPRICACFFKHAPLDVNEPFYNIFLLFLRAVYSARFC